ncbi:MAG: amidophosphoribosyltransferase [Bacteroidia bacterium]|nr:amidophosphoribosyltransferase [Bacteroidia bacterium]
MNKFTIYSKNKYLNSNVQGYYHTYYTGYKKFDNPDYLNDLKNTFNNYSNEKLSIAMDKLFEVLKNDLSAFDKGLTICVVPRSKAEKTYSHKQLLFKKVVQCLIEKLGFQDGSNYITRHIDTITTHLTHSTKAAQYAGGGSMPYPGITKDTCSISNNVKDKKILLIDDIYTNNVNIDEDAIQALFDHGANSIIFYAVGKTI